MLASLSDVELLAAILLVAPLGCLLILLFSFERNLRETATLATAAALFLGIVELAGRVLAGARPGLEVAEIAPGFSIAFAVEPLGMLFAVIASGLWIVNSIYSIGYMRGNDEPRQTVFYLCFAIAIAATIALALSANLVTLFIFYEILTISTYPLVVHKANSEAVAAGRVYLALLMGSSVVLLLPAVIFTYALAGTTDFTAGGVLAGKADYATLGFLLFLFAFGIGKAALMPGHFWLPAAMVAPTPVSALLHAVAVVKAGVFTLLKVVVYTFGLDALSASGQGEWLVWLAGFTLITASLIALHQDNLKKRLAYSTVSQLSYVILAAAILTPISAVGAAMHIAAHAVSKITLFFAAGSVYTAAHITEISQMRGIGRRMPVTMGAFAIGAISMIGLPPTAGFLGKWFILSGAAGSGQWFAVAVIVASTVLNACYFLPIIYTAFLPPAADVGAAHASGHARADEFHGAPWQIVFAISMTALMTLALFFYPDPVLELARQMVVVGEGR
ncbi:MAG: monovalent cation/H+ antiporter subunit D family protein [Rhizobiales bacterium]|nr:monovalent cation/H+ antiporter subunit D family protein [Hyphomicrobiales bacterium]